MTLPPGTTTEVLPSIRLSSADAPGLVVEGSPRQIRVGGRTLPRGERWLLRPGQSVTVGGARIVAGWDDPGTASEARQVLRAALRGEAIAGGPELVAIAGPMAGRRVRLRPGVLGRGADSATRLEDPSVSRVHARLEIEGSRIRVEDLGSKNGSWIGGERLAGLRELSPGGELQAGRTVLALSLAPTDAPAQEASGERRSGPWQARGGMLLAAAAAAVAALLAL